MERLTGRDEKGNLTVEGKEVYAGYLYNAASYLEEYENIGLTPEQIRELKERDKSKPPIYQVQGDERYEQEPEWWMCPCCDEVYDMDDDYDFCPKCGQRLLR